MRLEISSDDDLRYVRREQEPDRTPERPISGSEPEPLVEPGPLDRRVSDLREQAAQSRLPEIPRRRYDRQRIEKLSVKHDRDPVRSRHRLQPGLSAIRLREEEKRLRGGTGRFRVTAVEDVGADYI
jgi:hypothetical protein